MKVLIACEYSGRVRNAFAALGHDVLSADFEPAEDGSAYHYQGDCFDLINDQHFDLMIAHPPCTYLSVSGMHWTTRGLRDPKLTEDALEFVKKLMAAPIEKIVIENPVSVISSRIRKPDQIVQPWHFGEDASKKTCLWLKGLPKLAHYEPTVCPPKGWSKVMSAADMLECEMCSEPFCPECNAHYADCNCIGPHEDEATFKNVDGIQFATRILPPPKMIWGNQTASGQNKLAPSPTRWKERSRTYQGIADAMAAQWGGGAVQKALDWHKRNDAAALKQQQQTTEQNMTSEQKDAERYRFLRDQFALRSQDDEAEFAKLAAISGEAFDQVIDAAMKETA